MLKKIALGTMMALLLLGVLLTSMPVGTGQQPRVVKIVNAQTGSNSTSLGSGVLPVPIGGYPFTVNVSLEGATNDLFTYQVAVKFNRTLVRCTGAWINSDDPSFVFYPNRGATIVIPASIDNDNGVALLGATLIGDFSQNTQGGLLCQINLTAIAEGSSTVEIVPTGGYLDDTFLWNTSQIEMSFARQDFQVTMFAGETPPVSSFSFTPLNPAANQTVRFDGSESYDPNFDTLEYLWDFGDDFNQTEEESLAFHNYTRNGPYPVNLTVVENQTAQHYSNTMIREIQVGGIPHASFTYAPLDLSPLQLVTFNASASVDTDGGTIANYTWDFGDGNVTTVDTQTITHVFSAKGAYSVNLTVRDNDNLHDSVAQDVFVGRAPVASFTFSPANPRQLDVVTFDASQSHGAETGDYLSAYVWDFDDFNVTAVNSTASNPWMIKHTFLGEGNYTVDLVVYDNHGLYNSTSRTLTVQPLQRSGPDYTLYIVAGAVIVVLMVATVALEMRKPRTKRQPKVTPSKTKTQPKP